MYFQSG